MARAINVALVNSMPDGAFVDTEHQFRDATMGVGGPGSVNLSLYTMPGLTRSEAVAAEIHSRYSGLEELWETSPDAVIITGTEPVQAKLQYEPYWPHLSQLLQWAAASVPTTLLSCLAAHASLLIFDGIERRPLPAKCSGVLEGKVVPGSGPLAADLGAVVSVPHSRVNDIPEAALRDAGYVVVIGEGPGAPGWSVATRTQDQSTFVLCQGHLEYSTESLLREYRRDIRRFLLGRGAVGYPVIPSGYLSDEMTQLLEEFASEATEPSGADPMELYKRFPYAEVSADLANSWAESSATFFRNWLQLASVPVGAGASDGE